MKHNLTLKRILIYRLGSLGDTIIVLPAFHLIRQAFPNAEITLLTNEPINGKAPAIQSILENTKLYDDAIAYPSSYRNFKKLILLALKIRRQRFDAFVYLAKPKGGFLNVFRDYLFFKGASAGKAIGIPWEKSKRECLPLKDKPDLFEWDCYRTLRCLEELGNIDLESQASWDLQLTDAELKEAELLLNSLNSKPYIVLSVGTKAPSKDWENDNWYKLVERLQHSYQRYELVFVGSPDESARSEFLIKNGNGLNLCGKTTPRVAAAILKNAKLFVGHDSGPMHLAACVGTRVVAIFSARALPGEWFPRGGKNNFIHYHKTDCFNCGLINCIVEKKRCILSITVDEVYQSIEQSLN